jgi:ADP-ribosylglycohydrolase
VTSVYERISGAPAPLTSLHRRAAGCLAGVGVGDALGAPTETRTPAQIYERYGGWVEEVVEPWGEPRPLAPFKQGDGYITDDTMMTQALVEVYLEKRDHLDAYDVANLLVPRIIGETRWIPELEREDILKERLFLSVNWLVLRIYYGHVEPREAGVGNMMDSGAAMYVAPVGIVNAANPDRAYAEAIDLAGAQQCSFAREAAGVLAAGVAAALAPDADVESVVATCLRVAKDGTRRAIEAVCAVARELPHWTERGVLEALRAAVAPYDTMGADYTDLSPLGARRPSRTHSIEELPVAVGLFLLAGGDCRDTVLGGVNYGRDSDTIASLGGALAGALGGLDAVPADWVQQVAEASRTDLVTPALELADVAVEIFRKDERRRRAHAAAFRRLAGSTQA